MKFIRLFVCAISCIFCVGIYAQTYVQEIEKITNKRLITQKDFPIIDSLLSVVKKEEGINNNHFSKLAVTRINKTFGKQKSEIHPLYDDFLTVALDQDIPFDLLKKALSHIVSEYSADDNKWFRSMNTAWQAELKHASTTDTIDSKILKSFLIKLSSKKEYEKADSILYSYIDFISNVYGTNNKMMEDALSFRSDNYDKWILYSPDNKKVNIFNNRILNDKQLLSNIKISSGENSFRYQNALANLASELFKAKNDAIGLSKDKIINSQKDGIDLLKQWVWLKSDTLNIENRINYQALYNLYSNVYWVENDTVLCRKYARIYNDKYKDRYGENSKEYFEALDLSRMYFSPEEQSVIIDNQIELAEKLFGTGDYRYQGLLLEKSNLLRQKGDLGGAIASINTVQPDRSFAQLNSQYGNYKEARRIYKLAVRDDLERKDYLTALNLYSDIMGCFQDYKKYNQTDSIFTYADEILSLIPDQTELQSNIIRGAAFTEPKQQAIQFIQTQLDKYPDLTKVEIGSALLYCMGEINARIGNYDQALGLGNQAMQLSEKREAQLKHSLFQEMVYLLKQDFLKAKAANDAAQNILAALSDNKENYLEFPSLTYRSALESLYLKDNSNAVASLDLCRKLVSDVPQMQSLIITDQIWDAGSLFLIMNYMGTFDSGISQLLAEAKYLSGDLEDAMQVVKPYLEELYTTFNSVMGIYVTQNKMAELKNLANEAQNEFAKWSSRLDDRDINNMAYNVCLTTKQLTLTTANNIKRIVGESGNDELRKKISEISDLENKISELVMQGQPVGDFAARKNALQTQIAVDVNQIGNIFEKLNTEWQSIQKSLSADDCAVEFSSFRNLDGENTYTATILTQNTAPETLALFGESVFNTDKVAYDSAYYQTVWKPIAERLDGKGIKNIYFSPSGALHLSPIEYIPINESENIDDRYNMFRLSSTRELVSPRTIVHKDAAIFGGIDYDNKPVTDADDNLRLDRDLVDIFDFLDEDSRSGVNYLPGTRIEADTINVMLSKRIPVKLYVGGEGTETQLKNYSHHSPSILHIATHGFYWTKKDAQRSSGVGFLAALNNDGISQEDRDMSRSGILLSGANKTLTGKYSNIADDGVLTAKEAASIDLSGSDLVVMSACQSALGEVSGEGVFGLQRGLKMAGVNTMLMTLWKVNDHATQILMTEFYKNLLSGKTKLESLTLAQKYVREYEEEIDIADDVDMTASQRRKSERLDSKSENITLGKTKVKPFADPKYWAAFVLLDALN